MSQFRQQIPNDLPVKLLLLLFFFHLKIVNLQFWVIHNCDFWICLAVREKEIVRNFSKWNNSGIFILIAAQLNV